MESEPNWLLTFLLAVLFDLADFFGGMAPIVGDFFDLLETGVFYVITKDPISLATLFELVPLMDVVPSYTVAAAFLYYRGRES
ncbi:MAG: hypothetical protein QXJ17_04455 [Nitrososphaeria archaeon]